jgi:hypothetical protein
MNTGVLQRLRLKAKHGLILQEILNTLGRRGLWFCPYIVYCEVGVPFSGDKFRAQQLKYRELLPPETPTIAAMGGRQLSEAEIAGRFTCGDVAFGTFHGERLVACTWANLRHFPGLGDSPPVRDLNSEEAYLYDAYTIREFRGRAIIPELRNCLYGALHTAGRRKFYSVSVYFNRSARRFKEKLGARELELRFSVNIFGRIRKDFLIRAHSD